MKSRYNGQIDCLKFVMACIIMLMHTWQKFADASFLHMGGYAVEFFFAVSGALMCASAAKAEEKEARISLGKETMGFILRKIKKILLPYLVCFFMIFVMWMNVKGQVILLEEGKAALINDIICMLPNLLLLSQSGILVDETLVNISWYVSAMLIAMLLLYPLVRKYKQNFCLIAAPLVCLLGTGYLYCVVGKYKGIHNFLVFAPQGVWRALIGLCVGCVIYEFAAILREKNFTKFSRILLGIAGIILFGLFIFIVQYGTAKAGFFINILLFFWLSILFSKQNVGAKLFDNKISKILGEASLYLYFLHITAKNLIGIYIQPSSIREALVYMVFISGVLVAVMFVITRLYGRIKPVHFKLKSLFVSDSAD